MSGITLVAGSLNHSRLIEKHSKNGNRIIHMPEKGDGEASADPSQQPSSEKAKPAVVWNKRSPLSARNAILTAVNEYGRVDEAVLCIEASDTAKTFHELSTPMYDLQIDRIIKGYGYLIKELIQLFIKQNGGRLLILIDNGGRTHMPPVDSAIFSYIRSLSRSLSSLYQNEAFRIYCFESESSRTDDFISYVFKTADESRFSPGKLYKFADRKSIFDFGR